MTRVVLRVVAVLIAIAGIVDPVLTLARRVRQPLVVAVDGTLQPALTSAARLQELLDEEYDIRLRIVDERSRLTACAPGESCVLIGGDRWRVGRSGLLAPHKGVPSERIVGAIRVEEEAKPLVAIANATMPTPAHASAIGRLLVDVEGQGVTGQQSTFDVFDGDVPIGRATHTWTRDGRVTIPIEWWPLEAGLRRLSIRATRDGLENQGLDDRIDVGVRVEAEPYNVLVYDTRPSWTSTFVRRAIEHDARLALRVAAKLGPRLEVTAGPPFRLDDATLTAASAVVIGAPDGLSVQEVSALERFVRVRGGSLVLVPDRRPTGPIARLLHGGTGAASISSSMVERLEPAPIRVGEWLASELLLFRDIRPGSSILAKANADLSTEASGAKVDAVVVASPSGAGRIVVSGAMDAWRYRDADGKAFDRAWQTLIADAASAGGRSLELTLDRSVVRPADDVHVTARLRSMAAPDAAVAVSATIACGDQPARMLRLWPTGDRRRFTARISASASGTCEVRVSSSAPVSATATAHLVVAEDIHRGAIPYKGTVPSWRLELITRVAGARIVEAGDETTLAGDVQRFVPADLAPSRVRPMRSPWWILPFAGCLGVEWWLRRRQGMR
jgi:hypothetical protein